MTPLGRIIAARIAAEGPMRLDDYMRLCLMHPSHGYYSTRDPFGTKGDFTTAPEISQMFGELVGLALAQAWLDQGAPAPFTLAELGPGRGTLMADLLRATRRVPGFHQAARVTLVETSPHLRQVQRERLGEITHLSSVTELPEAPLFLVANEFFDALPVRQLQRVTGGWAERMVTLDARGGLMLALAAPVSLPREAPEGEVWEICAEGAAIMETVATRIAAHGGAAIAIDYGTWNGKGDSLQALRRHALRNALIPVLTILGMQFSFLLAGAIIIENVFYLPGLGRLIFQAISQRDLVVVQSAVLVLVAAVILVTFLVDLAYAAVDPRLRGR